jgi:AmmeMemoRadiSam system protein B
MPRGEKSVRPPAVAGTFYPGDPTVLASTVDGLIASRSGDAGPAPKALVVPHAGYVYSGPIAASAYARLVQARDRIRRVVLMGPAHRVPFDGLALPEAGAFETPLGLVHIDAAARDAVRDLTSVIVSDDAHRDEHSLEVQLPFLQRVLGDFTLVPFAVGDAEPDAIARVIDALWGEDETLVLISSDLSHYLSYDVAQSADARTAERIVGRRVLEHHQACGATPLNGLLLEARRRNLKSEVLDLRNSGDTAGPRGRVVGYGAFAFHEPHAAH